MTPAERLASVGVVCSLPLPKVNWSLPLPRVRDAFAACEGVERGVGMRGAVAFVLVFLGGGLGAALRHGINLLVARLLGGGFPYGTLLVNVAGSLIMGLMIEYFALKSGISQRWVLFLTTGILGGFTTFSTFSLDAALLSERGHLMTAAAYVAASVALGIGGLFAGMSIVRVLI
jgi:fluoride exporter